MTGRFDPEKHQYWLTDGKTERPVPSVTQVLNAVLGQTWQASEWYLTRGRAVHACCAMIARGREFEFDERIKGQVEACREFFRRFQPEPLDIEVQHYEKVYQYAGTPDLVCRMPGCFKNRRVIIDYKASLTPVVELQLGAYGELAKCDLGLGLELHDDGTFKVSGLHDLKRPRREFLSLLTTYKIMERLGKLPKEEAA